MVCEDCERQFSSVDDYANRLLIVNRAVAKSVVDGEQVLAYVYERFDYQKLKLFFLSLLWRASESSHIFYRNVNLGPHDFPIRQAIINSNPGNADFYSVVLAKFPRPYGILGPHATRFDGINFCQIYLAEYVAYIKVDNRPLPNSFQGLELKDGTQLVLLARDPAISKDAQIMRSIALKNQQYIKSK